MVAIEIEAFDRKHLLRDITAVLGDLHINITSAQVTTRKDRQAVLRFTFELADPVHLQYALRSVPQRRRRLRRLPRGPGGGRAA